MSTDCKSCADKYEEYSPTQNDCKLTPDPTPDPTPTPTPDPTPAPIPCVAPCSICLANTSKCYSCIGKGRDAGSDCKSCAAFYEENSPPQADCLISC